MLSRYGNTKAINVSTTEDGTAVTKRVLSTSPGLAKKIRDGINNGNIDFATRMVGGGERLDTIAGKQYGDSSLWWVIAAANGIGYAMQIKEGRELIVPTNLEQIAIII